MMSPRQASFRCTVQTKYKLILHAPCSIALHRPASHTAHALQHRPALGIPGEPRNESRKKFTVLLRMRLIRWSDSCRYQHMSWWLLLCCLGVLSLTCEGQFHEATDQVPFDASQHQTAMLGEGMDSIEEVMPQHRSLQQKDASGACPPLSKASQQLESTSVRQSLA